MIRVSSELAARMKEAEGFNAGACFHCGTCTALCPLGYEILPRKLFREVMLGLEDRVRAQYPADLLLPAVPHVRRELSVGGPYRGEHSHPPLPDQPARVWPEVGDYRMPLPIAPILGILSDNLRKRGSVLPLSKRAATGWARGLDLPRGGETVLYTGHMYQMIPALEVMSSQMAALENSFMTRFMGMGRLLNKFVNLSFFMSPHRFVGKNAAFQPGIARHCRAASRRGGQVWLSVRRRTLRRRSRS